MILRRQNSNGAARQTRKSIKQVADWLGISEATFFRWLRSGLISRLPQSPQEARALRSLIEEAKEAAYLRRPQNQKGRTTRSEIAKRIKGVGK